ncbi:MAG TPA: TIGR03118 family protein [Bryobacteraceae bacterium]|nr:TIGR03118 family protein [Bryobacteraceae bacterium]
MISVAPLFAGSFTQTNLVSNIPGLAPVTDPNLVNPWGISASATSPFWVSNQGTSTSTLYSGTGVKSPLTVTVPPTGAPPTGPTGQVFNSAGAGNFLDPNNNAPASFIFATLAGSIDVWNNSNGTTAVVVAPPSGGAYTGLALANNAGANLLYAANFVPGGGIHVFNSSFAATTLGGSFTDPNLPAGYSPYNIQNLNGKLYVEYAKIDPVTHRAAVGAGLGYVNVFDTNGNLLQRLASNGPLDAPWGIAVAPAGFGSFANDLLVGNFGDGTINAFDPITGNWLGSLTDPFGNPIVNSGLWGIQFGNSSADPNALYFAAGINNETDGLFGLIQATPEPAAAGLVALGVLGMLGYARRRSRKSAA